jgi:hypothetical protein
MPRIGLPADSTGKRSDEFLDLGSQFSASIAGVDDRARLQQQHRGFGIGPRTVLDATGNDEELPRPQHHIAVSHLNGEPPVEDHEELIGVGMPVLRKLALDLHDADVIIVDLGYLLRRPVLRETRQYHVQIHRFHGPYRDMQPSSASKGRCPGSDVLSCRDEVRCRVVS